MVIPRYSIFQFLRYQVLFVADFAYRRDFSEEKTFPENACVRLMLARESGGEKSIYSKDYVGGLKKGARMIILGESK